MSAATEFASEFGNEFATDVRTPVRARYSPPPERLASVTVLHPPDAADAPAVRLTPRGLVVVCIAVALLAAGLVWVAWLSAPDSAARTPPPQQSAAVVTVQPGDSLWSLATWIAPGRDPRAEVAALQRINHLSGAELLPGQLLRTR
jgi:hypothetical protein